MLLICFHVDLDGTLWDAEARNRGIVEREALRLNPNLPSNPEYWAQMWVNHAGKTETHLHAVFGLAGRAEDFERLCRDQWSKNLGDVTIRQDLLDFLARRSLEEGNTVGIVTSSRRQDTADYLMLAGAFHDNPDQIFKTIVSCDDIADPRDRKPSPHPYLLSAERMGATDSTTHIGFEDSPSGAESFLKAFPAGVLFYFGADELTCNHPNVIQVSNAEEIESYWNEAQTQTATIAAIRHIPSDRRLGL